MVGLGVVGGAADVRGEHHVGHADERVVGGDVLALEVVERGAAEVAGGEGGGEGVEVVEPGAGGVDVHRALAHGGELRRRPSARASRA